MITLLRKRPKKYADGEYILLESSLFITGAYSGTWITTFTDALTLS